MIAGLTVAVRMVPGCSGASWDTCRMAKTEVDEAARGRSAATQRSISTTLLRWLEPHLHDESYVFCSLRRAATADEIGLAIAVVREQEGTTLVLSEKDATGPGSQRSGTMSKITLTVHSSLEAVGLTAAVAGALTADGIACNVVAGFHHDHLFVPAGPAAMLMALRALSRSPGCDRR